MKITSIEKKKLRDMTTEELRQTLDAIIKTGDALEEELERRLEEVERELAIAIYDWRMKK